MRHITLADPSRIRLRPHPRPQRDPVLFQFCFPIRFRPKAPVLEVDAPNGVAPLHGNPGFASEYRRVVLILEGRFITFSDTRGLHVRKKGGWVETLLVRPFYFKL